MLEWLKNNLRNHFGLSSAEAKGTAILLLLTLASLCIPQLMAWYASRQPSPSHKQEILALEHALQQLKSRNLVVQDKPSSSRSYASRKPKKVRFDINKADEAQLKRIRGIGPVLSARIIKFRNKLGGFVHTGQLSEVYGLSPEVVKRLQKDAYIDPHFLPQQIAINLADIRTLAAHPYCSYQQARAIVRYREQHGQYAHLDTLRSLILIDSASLSKMKPYLRLH